MKNYTKIITLVLSLALVIGAAVAIGASADAAAPDVVAKNVKTDGNFCLMFAVDPATVAGENVTLKVYDKAPAEGVEAIQTITLAKTATTKIDYDKDGVENEDMLVFETKGVSAKDIADVWYYTVESAGVVSDADTYSVREYAFERLYGDNKVAATDSYGMKQKAFYLSILEVGSTAQDLLVNTKLEEEGKAPERLANEYSYAAIVNGSFGDASQKFVEIGDTLTLPGKTAANDAAWKVYTYGTNGALIKSEVLALGATVTVEGNTVVLPGWLEGLTPGKYFQDLGDAKLSFDNVTFADTGLYTNLANKPAQNKYGNYSFVDVDGRGQVLKLAKDGEKEVGGAATRIPVVDKANGEGNCVVAEFDIKFDGDFTFYDSEYKTDKFIGTALNMVLGKTEPNVDEAYKWQSAGTATNQISSSAFYMIDTDAVKTGSNVVGGDYMSVTNSTSSVAKYKLDCNTWYNVCLEWYDAPDENRTYVRMYINGTLFYSTYGSFTTSNTTSNVEEYDYNHVQEAKTLRFTLQDRFRPADVFIDNLFVGIIKKDLAK